MPVTIKDVARESGVNVSTVSRALNGEYGVHADTRELVVAVAQRLRYRPNRVAQGLVTGRSHTLALMVSDIRNLFFAEVPRGLRSRALQQRPGRREADAVRAIAHGEARGRHTDEFRGGAEQKATGAA